MRLFTWCLAALLRTFLLDMSLLTYPIQFSEVIHHFFKNYIFSLGSEYSWFYAAILIGDDTGIRNRPEAQSFIILGLYHLIVVSGSHFTMLEKLMSHLLIKFGKHTKFSTILIIMTFFCIVNRLQPACMRAYLSWILSKLLGDKSNSSEIFVGSILIALIIEPKWAISLSFQLSACASLALIICEGIKGGRLIKAAICTIMMCPLLYTITPCLSWIIIPSNIFLMPVVEVILIPAAIAATFFSFTEFICSLMFKFLFSILNTISNFDAPLFCFTLVKGTQWGLIYVFAIFCVWLSLLPYLQRHQFQKDQNQIVDS